MSFEPTPAHWNKLRLRKKAYTCLHPRPSVGVCLPHLVPDLLREQPAAPLLSVPENASFPHRAGASGIRKKIDVCQLGLQNPHLYVNEDAVTHIHEEFRGMLPCSFGSTEMQALTDETVRIVMLVLLYWLLVASCNLHWICAFGKRVDAYESVGR